MLKVYAWSVCPHCHKAIAWLNEQYEAQQERWTEAKNASWV